MSDPCSVKVAVRVRPLVPSEISKGCKDIIDVVTENQQIVIKGNLDKPMAFTYNYVLGPNSSQDELYLQCVQPILKNLYEGFNVTIFAYGQTGSGKTHSMGTAYKGEEDTGVIPRAVKELFDFSHDNFKLDFTFTVSFIELYQEVLYDLLSGKSREQSALELREDNKSIYIPDLTEVSVTTFSDVLNLLTKGTSGRATGATAMNAQSSRSHAIFTINISVHPKDNPKDHKTAKLHLVDLAGSERPKKTGAVGTTFKEGVNINKGLFVLGNVISCLGDEKQQHSHIPYRESNLTRLLKDSLGGNSITLMIACVSPADYNFDETVSTLRYADRARKIKNKPIVNQDPKAAEIAELKKTVQQLRLQIIGQGGPVICPAEIELQKQEILQLKLKIRDLTMQLSSTLGEKTVLHERIILLQNIIEDLKRQLNEIQQQYDITTINMSQGLEKNDPQSIKDCLSKFQELQKQFDDINVQQKKAEDEIRNHEETFSLSLNTSKEAGEPVTELHETQTTHYNNKQMQFDNELREISKQLAVKEHLAQQLATNTAIMVDYAAIAEHEAKINALQKEKDELQQQLKNVKSQEISSKIAEQRRKRVQELEAQIHDLHKKVQEQSRLIKLKEKDEVRIKQLNQEIVQMKQNKVRLIRNMKEESERFRQWKLQNQRELAKVKQQDRKKETEIAKMRAMHEKQQNVFKRKVEEAAALNKRLKDTLALRQQVQNTKISGKVERIGPWIKQEFDILANLIEAEATLEGLLEDRATLQSQLEELKSNSQIASDSQEIKSLEEDIELRSVQIQDLQQKILDSDEENKSKTRFDNIQTMGEAKFALNRIFEYTTEFQKEKIHKQMKLNELQYSHNEAVQKIKTLEKKIETVNEESQDKISQFQNIYEEKIAILLRHLRGVKVEGKNESTELEKLCSIQEERIGEQEQKISHLESQNSELQAQIDVLKTRLDDIQHVAKKTQKKKKPEPEPEEPNGTFTVNGNTMKLEDIIGDISSEEDDDKCDPDWRKTPLGKRILAEKKRYTFPKANIMLTEPGPVKRCSDGGCTCKTACLNRCGCKKLSRKCGTNCKCNASTCENQENENENMELGEDNSETGDFKKPKIEPKTQEENHVTKRSKKRIFH